MKKGFVNLIIIVVLVSLTAIFVIPYPRYQGKVLCKPNSPCPIEGWRLEKPLFWSVILPKIQEQRQITIGLPDESSTQTNSSSTDETTNWKTYTNSKPIFSFKYPPEWEITDESTEAIKLENSGAGLLITVTTYNPSVVGATYCQAVLDDKTRCEIFENVIIDWGESSGIDVSAQIVKADLGLNIVLTTNPNVPATFYLSDDIKELFRKILSTFRFE